MVLYVPLGVLVTPEAGCVWLDRLDSLRSTVNGTVGTIGSLGHPRG